MQNIAQSLSETIKFKMLKQYIASSKQKMYFIHKWTRKNIEYTDYELSLPCEVNILGKSKFDINVPTIAFGGTRSPTPEAFMQAHEIATNLAAKGYLLISGGVVGIDLAMHMGALESYVDFPVTCAVLANPVEYMLKGHGWNENKISKDIYDYGYFISEYTSFSPIGSREYKDRLLQRDRIISGLSDIFLAFECSVDSATVDTAKRAYLQGKKVYVVHPKKDSKRRGTYQLAEEEWVEEFDINY